MQINHPASCPLGLFSQAASGSCCRKHKAQFAMEICLSEPACYFAECLVVSQHCKGSFHVTEELPSACADNLRRSTSEAFIVMNHTVMNSPVVGGGPDLEMAQHPAHLLSDT